MSVGIFPLKSSTSTPGLRPVDVRRDLAQIAALMDLCFGDTMDQHGRGAVREMEALSRTGPLLWFLGAMTPAWQLGFVWIENGKVIGNVSTQMSEYDKRTWLIANVAVHPDYRRRGIATALTEAALQLAQKSGGRRVLLQVHQHNTGAYTLYHDLGFTTVTTRTTWERVSVSDPPKISLPDIELRPARKDEWETDFAFARQLRPAGFNWLRPLRKADWRPSLWRTLGNFLSGARDEHWLALCENQLVGAFYIEAGLSATDQIHFFVLPDWQGRLERPLLSAALRRLGRRPWSTRIEHPTPDDPVEAALKEFGFRTLQTLIWMQKDVAGTVPNRD